MSKFALAARTSHTLSLAAMEEASRVGQRTADIDHLFLALVLSEQPAGQILRGLGITLEAARAAVNAQHAEQLGSLGIMVTPPQAQRIVFHETGGYEWSKTAMEILKHSSGGGKPGDATAVLRELLSERSGLIGQILRRLSVDPDTILGRLQSVEEIPKHRPRPSIARDGRSGSVDAFIAAPPALVWALLDDPRRMPEWEAAIGSVDPGAHHNAPGDSWAARAVTSRPDGKAIRIKPQYRSLHIELLRRETEHSIEWRISYPDATRGYSREVRVDLEPEVGGSRITIDFRWVRGSERRRARLWPRFIPRLVVWITLSQTAAAIGRVFR